MCLLAEGEKCQRCWKILPEVEKSLEKEYAKDVKPCSILKSFWAMAFIIHF